MTTFEKVREVVADQFGDVNIEEITMDTKIREDLDGDSLDVLEIVMAIEEDFEIEIPDSDLHPDKCNVGAIVEYIDQRLK